MPVHVRKGRLISMPYSLEMNDVIAYNSNRCPPRHYATIIRRQFDQLYAEGENSGTVMCIPLHPYLVGQPHRIRPLCRSTWSISRGTTRSGWQRAAKSRSIFLRITSMPIAAACVAAAA